MHELLTCLYKFYCLSVMDGTRWLITTTELPAVAHRQEFGEDRFEETPSETLNNYYKVSLTYDGNLLSSAITK